ncbi:MAG: hypothetical protein WBO23_19475 [Burkholderiales bacterium]
MTLIRASLGKGSAASVIAAADRIPKVAWDKFVAMLYGGIRK